MPATPLPKSPFAGIEHPNVPVLGDDRSPVAGEIDRRDSPSRSEAEQPGRRDPAPAPEVRLKRTAPLEATPPATRQSDRDHTKAIRQFNWSIRKLVNS